MQWGPWPAESIGAAVTTATDAIGAQSTTNVTTVVSEARRFVETATTTQGRAVMTALVLLCTVLAAAVVVPLVVAHARRFLASRVFDNRVANGFELLGEYVPTTMSGLVVRTAQGGILVAAVLTLLVVWGLVEMAVTSASLLVDAIPQLINGVLTLVLLFLAYVGSDQLKRGIRRFSQGAERVTEHQEEIMLRVGQVVLFVGVGGAILTLWNFDLSGLLVGAGFLGIVVGLAARQTLGSLIAGFVLMFARPFTVGDWIEAGDQQGIVTNITIMNTRLQNFDGETVIIPNDKIGDRSLTNRSANGRLRIRSEVGVDYETDLDEARAVAQQAIEDVDVVEDSPTPEVVPKTFDESSIVLELRYWIEHPSPPRKWRAVAGVLTNVKGAFADADISIPFPQREMSTRNSDRNGGPKQAADPAKQAAVAGDDSVSDADGDD